MRRTGGAVLVVGAAAGCLFLGLPLLMAVLVMGGTVEQGASCPPADDSVVLVDADSAPAFTDEQLANAANIITEGYRLAVPERGLLVALAVASQESRFLNYANDGQGNDLAPEQRGIERSLELPHEAVGSDHGSLGVFQQQWPWWGTIEELMDPATAARKFFAALDKVPGWEDMEVGEAGQAVQQSAHPDAYDDDVATAEALLASAGSGGIEEAGYFGGVNAECANADYYGGDVVMPLPEGASYVDRANFGQAGDLWESTHTGTDFSTACGTPVVASTAGVVTVSTDEPWSGPWLVQIDSGQGGVVTWYSHMQAVDVETGDEVSPGQVIGAVGDLGNSTGCHLHFEVRPGGGDPVDPTQWLAENVGREIVTVSDEGREGLGDTAVLITANVAFWLSDAAPRSHITGLLDEGPDVLLLQEVTNRDVASIAESASGTWAVWQPEGSKGGSAIVWDASKFSAVRRGVELGFDGHEYDRWMPWVLLTSDSGTLPVVGLHLPTRSSSDPTMRAYFQTMTANYVRLIGQLNEAGYPPVVGGDWNHPLDVAREPWSPVPVLEGVEMTTNWQVGSPCDESVPGGRIDGFAFNPSYLQVVDQGCLPMGPSDHRPVWVAVAPSA